MSLYGALFGGVSGLKAQGSKIGVISDNISNVNTVGYKQSQAAFETLVTNSSSSTGSYQTGGVRGSSRLDVSKQGLLQSTDAPTDIAISGSGFFVVNSAANGANTPVYTRAGSFRQDAEGNFINTAGFYLQAWPLDQEGRLPGAPGNSNTVSSGNLDSLETVKVESSSGVAIATSTVSIGANLKSSEKVYKGAGAVFTMDQLSANNRGIGSDDIIVSGEYGMAPTNSIRRGDFMQINTNTGGTFDYEYGGFTAGRSVAILGGIANQGDLKFDNATDATLAPGSVVTFGTASFDITIPDHGLVTGDRITLAGLPAIGTTPTPASELNTAHTVTFVDANTVRITVGTGHGIVSPATASNATAGTADYRKFTGNILDATTASGAFLSDSGTSRFTTDALTFKVSTPSLGTSTFRYVNQSPNASTGEFNSLSTLAAAIDQVQGLTARVVNSRLVVAAEDANESVTFANGDDTTSTQSQVGLDWVSELGLVNVEAGTRRFNTMQGLANIVNQTDGDILSAEVTSPLTNSRLAINIKDPQAEISFSDMKTSILMQPTAPDNYVVPATVAAGQPVDVVINIDAARIDGELEVGDSIVISGETNGLGGLPGILPNTPELAKFQVVARTATSITVRIPGEYNTGVTAGTTAAASGAATISVIGKSNQGSLMAELGLQSEDGETTVASLNGTSYFVAQPKGIDDIGPRYDASAVNGENMASGDITPQFSNSVRIYDALGTGHDLSFSYIKLSDNQWAVEVYAIPKEDVSSTLTDGQVATGTITFNGDGTLRGVTPGLANPLNIAWTNGAISSNVTIDWGTAGPVFGTAGAAVTGKADGLTQSDGDYSVAFTNQNGSALGELISVSIDDEGFVVASYSNGESRNLYKIPLAQFTNPNGLNAITGNVYAGSLDSGEVQLREPGTSGVGEIVPSSLEQSNVELSEQLTDMIVAQRAYQANTKVISAADELLQQLNQLGN